MEECYNIEFKDLRKILDSNGNLKSDGLRDLAITSVAFANVQGGNIIIVFLFILLLNQLLQLLMVKFISELEIRTSLQEVRIL
jgi:hypothetical protein